MHTVYIIIYLYYIIYYTLYLLDEAGIASTSQLRFHELNDLDCVSYFVEGAEYGILDNYNPGQGIANGTTGIGVSLTWPDKYITHVKKAISKAKKDARKPRTTNNMFCPKADVNQCQS